MRALRAESSAEGGVMRLQSRVARIEGEVTYLNWHLASVETDLRDLRRSVDQRLDQVDAKIEAKVDRLDDKLEAAVEKFDAKIRQLRP